MEGYKKKKTFRHLCPAVLLTLCLTAVFRSGPYADARNVETVIPFSIKEDGSGHTYTVTLTPADGGSVDIQTETCKEGEDGFFAVSHTVPDMYVYTITEEDDGTEKITFDHSAYTVYVDVSSDDEGDLSSAVVVGKNETAGKPDSILFSNTFSDGSETEETESGTESESESETERETETKPSETTPQEPETKITETAPQEPETKITETTQQSETKTSEAVRPPETAEQTEIRTELPTETQQTEAGQTGIQTEPADEDQLHRKSTGETKTVSSEETRQKTTTQTEEQSESVSEIQSESGSIATGDSSRILLYAVMAVLSLAAGGVSAVYMSKRKHR